MMLSEVNTHRRPALLEDRTQASHQAYNRAASLNNASCAIVSVKQNNPYGAVVIPQDPNSELEQRYQRQQQLQLLHQQQSSPTATYMSNYHVQQYPQSPLLAVAEYHQTHFTGRFAGFLSERDVAASEHPNSPTVLPLQEAPINPANLTKFYSNGRPMVAFRAAPPSPDTSMTATPQTRAMPQQQQPSILSVSSVKTYSVKPAECEPSALRGEVVVTLKKRNGQEDCLIEAIEDLRTSDEGKFTTLSELSGVHVIFEGDRGKDLAVVVAAKSRSSLPATSKTEQPQALSKVYSIATKDEVDYYNTQLREEEEQARQFCQQEVDRLLPDRNFVIEQAIFQFGREKLTLLYRVPERCYFVPLLKALNQQYRCRIWMERVTDSPQPLSE